MVSAEDAIAKARAIAARLSGVPTAPDTTNVGDAPPPVAATVNVEDSAAAPSRPSKRPRWGVTPDSDDVNNNGTAIKNESNTAAVTGSLPPTNNNNNNRPLPGQVQKRIWVATTSDRPEGHFVKYLSRHLPDIVSNEFNHNVNDTDNHIAVVLQGRGTSAQATPGMPLEPLHILLTGTPGPVKQAHIRMEQLLLQAEQAPLEVDVEEANVNENANLSDTNNYNNYNNNSYGHVYNGEQTAATTTAAVDNSQALVTTTTTSDDYNNSIKKSEYRPASVALLIGRQNIGGAPMAGGSIEKILHVPNGVVGYIIGRGGENIARMQAQTGTKVQIQKETELQPGATTREITLQAPSQQALDECEVLVQQLVAERVKYLGGGVRNNNTTTTSSNSGISDPKVAAAVQAGHFLLAVQVPDADVGLIIGKLGMTIKHIQEQSGAQVQVPPLGENGVRTLQITHPTQAGAVTAQQMINQVLAQKLNHHNNNHGNSHVGAGGPQASVQVNVPDKDVGLCIGRQGCVIRQMQTLTNTRIQIPQQAMPGQEYRVVTVTGPQEGCQQVQQMLERISAEQSSASVMSGAPWNANVTAHQYYSNHSNPAVNGAAAATANTNDAYSAEWAAYYAAQAAAAGNAAAVAAHAQTAYAPTPAAAQAATPAPDAYYDQFFTYAYYYGEDAARQYYGAWSPPVGTPNPYGVNPNGITAAPTANAPAPAAAPESTSEVAASSADSNRETSQRKVSNLPAWMTQ